MSIVALGNNGRGPMLARGLTGGPAQVGVGALDTGQTPAMNAPAGQMPNPQAAPMGAPPPQMPPAMPPSPQLPPQAMGNALMANPVMGGPHMPMRNNNMGFMPRGLFGLR